MTLAEKLLWDAAYLATWANSEHIADANERRAFCRRIADEAVTVSRGVEPGKVVHATLTGKKLES